MFDLITGSATHIPRRSFVPFLVSTTLQAALATAVLLPILLVTGTLPQPPVMMAFVASPPPPPPPPPPPAPPAAPQREAKPATAVQPRQEAAPVVAPTRLETAPAAPPADFGAPGGVEGGVPGGVIGGIVGGLADAVPPPPPPPPPPAAQAAIRVGGQVQQPVLVRRVEPIYPTMAAHARLQGTVILEATVDRQGLVEDVRILRSAHALLDKAALDAVRQWQYSPVLLNGKPERFILTVVLSFNLALPEAEQRS
jgi:protein TonB